MLRVEDLISLLVAFSFTNSYVALGQQCAPNFPDLSDGIPMSSNSVHRQLIIPQYTFPCPGVITQWEAHINGLLDNINRLDFLVWRLDTVRQKYVIVGSSTYRSGEDTSQIIIREQNEKLFMKLESPKSRITVNSGDIVGVFIRGSPVRMTYLTNMNIRTYVYTTIEPLEAFSANSLENEFERYQPVAPLIRALVDVNGVTRNTTGFVPGLTTILPTHSTSTNTVRPPTGTNELPESFNTSSDYFISPSFGSATTENPNYRDYERHKMYLIIGIAAAGTVIFIMCICMVIILLAICVKVPRKKRDKESIAKSQQDTTQTTLSSGYSSENCSLSFLPIDSTSRLNLLAFRRQEAARNIGSAPDIVVENGGLYCNSNHMEDMPDSDTYVEIPPRVHIARSAVELCGTSASNPSLSNFGQNLVTLKKNPSYLVMHSANATEEHEYDEVPFVVSRRRPYEYEVPTTTTSNCSSARPTPTRHTDDDFVKDDKVIYEEIN